MSRVRRARPLIGAWCANTTEEFDSRVFSPVMVLDPSPEYHPVAGNHSCAQPERYLPRIVKKSSSGDPHN